jgi:hypothetical protein
MDGMKRNRGTYRADHEMKCCWNCRHSFQRMGITLICRNPGEWIMESGIEPVGICDSYEAKNGEDGKKVR